MGISGDASRLVRGAGRRASLESGTIMVGDGNASVVQIPAPSSRRRPAEATVDRLGAVGSGQCPQGRLDNVAVKPRGVAVGPARREGVSPRPSAVTAPVQRLRSTCRPIGAMAWPKPTHVRLRQRNQTPKLSVSTAPISTPIAVLLSVITSLGYSVCYRRAF